MSEIPGSTACHAWITDECRARAGDVGAIDEALERLRSEYEEIVRAWSVGEGAVFHAVLTFERPRYVPPSGER